MNGDGALCARCEALQTLGLPFDAADKEIESSYQVLLKAWDPARFTADSPAEKTAREQLKAIEAARTLLKSRAGRARRRAKAGARGSSDSGYRPSGAKRPWMQLRDGPTSAGAGSALTSVFLTAIALRIAVILGGLAALALVLTAADAALSSNAGARSVYAPLKASVLRSVEINTSRVWDSITRRFHKAPPAAAAPATEAASTGPPPEPKQATASPDTVTLPHLRELNAYVTTGQTQDEVVAALGVPSWASEQAMSYDGTMVYFLGGRVTGWKIDPAAPPIRVRLLPYGPVKAGLKTFALGSSRNDVLAVQGTPTMCTADKFGYGESEVFFENGQVIGWKNVPSSVKLRVASH